MKTLGIILGLVGVVLLAMGVFVGTGAQGLLHSDGSLMFPRQTLTLCGAIAVVLSFFIWKSKHLKQ